MSDRNTEWARAFHRQATSDFEVFRLLAAANLPPSHALHYLQMATEKIAKAYRLQGEIGAAPQSIRGHTGLVAFVQAIVRAPKLLEQRLGIQGYALPHARRKLVDVARKLEGLAPAVDEARQPRNAEYPWEVGTIVVAPVDEPFEDLNLHSHELIRFLSLLRVAIADF